MSEEQELAEFQEWLTEDRADRIVALSRKMHGREGGPAMTTSEERVNIDLTCPCGDGFHWQGLAARYERLGLRLDEKRWRAMHSRCSLAASQARAEERKACARLVEQAFTWISRHRYFTEEDRTVNVDRIAYLKAACDAIDVVLANIRARGGGETE